MGIQGLLPFLKEASTQINISDLRNYTVAIDSYCLLHKGAFGCAEKIARGEDTNGYVLYCLKYVKLLQQYNIKPIMVFDGQHLPAKKVTEEKRRLQRQQSKKQAQELLRLGKTSEAYSYIRRSIDITHKMALNLIKECRNMGIDCIVAPYEADAQLAYLNISGICQAVISEDSDLVLFGCKKIIYKLDLQGTATLVDAVNIPNCMKMRPDEYSFDKFRYMCILSGCDYLPSLQGIGLKKALKFVSMTANPSIYDVLPKLPSYLKLKDTVVTNEYRNQFMIADATIRHQIVYDPLKRKLQYLTDPSSLGTKEENLINAGKMYDSELAFKMALGNIDPFSLKELDDWAPSSNNTNKNSIWNCDYIKPREQLKSNHYVPQMKQLETKVNQLSKNEIEKLQEQEDAHINGELGMYLTKETVKRKREPEIDEAPPSPVLKKEIFNPFKKISKFKRTEVCNSEFQVSRYFLRRETHKIIKVSTESIGIQENTIGVNNTLQNECNKLDEERTVETEEGPVETEENILRTEGKTLMVQEKTVQIKDDTVISEQHFEINELDVTTEHNLNSTAQVSPILKSKRLESFIFKNKTKLMTIKRKMDEKLVNEISNSENLTPPNSQEIVCVENSVMETRLSGTEKIGNWIGKNMKKSNSFKGSNSVASNTTKKQKEVPKNQRTILSMFKFTRPPLI